ncbi:MAG: replication-relaxation family protein [Planctomycetota bacterium]
MRKLVIQERDISVFVDLGEFGLLSADMIHSLYWSGKTIRACQNRLHLYASHGLVHVMSVDVANAGLNSKQGRQPYLYSLTPKGADIVEDTIGERPRRVLQKPLKAMTLRHRQEIVTVRLAWDSACNSERFESPTWIMEQDIRQRKRNMPVAPRLLYHVFGEGEARAVCRPDAACLSELQIKGQLVSLLTFWEIDRSTEGQKQIRAKSPGYEMLLKQRSYSEYFRLPAKCEVRVMFVCKSESRIREMQKQTLTPLLKASFRYTTLPEVQNANLFRDPIWQNNAGKRGRVIPP